MKSNADDVGEEKEETFQRGERALALNFPHYSFFFVFL